MIGRDLLVQDALVRTIAFFDVLEYAPAWSECAAWVEWEVMGPSPSGASGSWSHGAFPERSLGVVEREIGEFTNSQIDESSDLPNAKTQTPNANLDPPSAEELVSARDILCTAGVLEYGMGRAALAGRLARLVATFFERMPLQTRKLRKASRIARVLARIPGVRFVALANTTAFGHAREGADLDFFVIAEAGRLWTVRALAAGPFRVLGKLSKPAGGAPDAPCFSYFISDAHLDVSSHELAPDDPYFRYWFLSLLPLFDDGVSETFWEVNAGVRAKHPRAEKWEAFSIWHLAFGKERQMPNAKRQMHHHSIRPISTFAANVEKTARILQRRWFPSAIRDRMNRDTSVIVSDDVLKFHVDDARLAFREAYEERLRNLGIVNNQTTQRSNDPLGKTV